MLKYNHSIRNLRNFVRQCSSQSNDHLEVVNLKKTFSQFPKEYRRTNLSKNPRSIYIAHNETAKKIFTIIQKYQKNVPFIEMNPGIGLLTKKLLTSNCSKLILCEYDKQFYFSLKKSYAEQRAIGFVDIYEKMNDCKNAIENKNWEDEIVAQVFCCISSAYFIRRMISSIVLQNQILDRGRVEFFFVMPEHNYHILTIGPEANYSMYRTFSCIFQILLKHEFLEKFEQKYFLPWWSELSKGKTKNKITAENKSFCLVRITPRRNLFSLCKPGDLKALAYFVEQLFSKRHAFIIPKLEQWIPGCGAQLICNQNYSIANSINEIYSTESQSPRELSTNYLYPNLTPFTKCGELTPFQIFSLFNIFMNLPEYKTSNFVQNVTDYYQRQQNPDNIKT